MEKLLTLVKSKRFITSVAAVIIAALIGYGVIDLETFKSVLQLLDM